MENQFHTQNSEELSSVIYVFFSTGISQVFIMSYTLIIQFSIDPN